eukprot:TRINITY_DN10103_c0_g2_i1.p1 TRINITY_DN10103_c0_g2~~TRINITY_DN10103_c0_g2_i1.p1  ORF type:complete len:399 (+),score=100.44 TRINITY_DN10103_c0_g2_i1:76-1197(+)
MAGSAADDCEVQLDEGVTAAIAGRIRPAPGQRHAEHLHCSVCDNSAFDTPVRTVPCGHMFHKECLGRWLKDKVGAAHNCPDCRKELPPGDGAHTAIDHISKSILDEATVECPQDCGEPPAKRMRFDGLEAHIRKECPNTPLLCSSKGCARVLPRKEMEEHLTACEHAIVHCKQCKNGIKRGALPEHKAETCTHRRYTCVYCKKKNLVYHKKGVHELECTGSVPVSVFADLQARLWRLERKAQDADKLREQTVRALTEPGRKVDLQRTVLAQALGVPEGLVVKSEEHARGNGTYLLLPERHSGAAVWGKGIYRIFKTPHQSWMVGSMGNATGFLLHRKLKRQPAPVASEGWLTFYGTSDNPWESAPRTSVTAAP